MSLLNPESVYQRLAAADWDFADVGQVDPLHGLHPYPAKFIPELPKSLIKHLTMPGDVVLDPFCGGGTTAVEALRAGRNFFGIDANPLAVHLTKVKCTSLTESDVGEIDKLLDSISGRVVTGIDIDAWEPNIPNCERWYSPEVFNALVGLRSHIMRLPDGAARNLALLVFANCASKASFQESETRYVSKPRNIEVNSIRSNFARDFQHAVEVLSTVASNSTLVKVIEGDSRNPSLYPTGVSAVITSPPYPNSFDYHLYHRFRLFWLGNGPQSLRQVEIGSHLNNQREISPTVKYLDDMNAIIANSFNSLLDGGWLVLVVGSGIHKGEIFNTGEELLNLSADIGFRTYPVITRQLPKHRRSVTSAGRRLTEEQLVVLRKPESVLEFSLGAPHYSLYPYEESLRRLEAQTVNPSVTAKDNSVGDIFLKGTEADISQLKKLAFSHEISGSDGSSHLTHSALLEFGSVKNRTRKNSTYLSHGIHRYKGKFYPQLVKSLINISGIDSGDTVIDPFGGSGTVALEANLSGINAISIDCNPVAVSIAKAKTDIIQIEPGSLTHFLDSLDFQKVEVSKISNEFNQFDSTVMLELQSWFPVSVLKKLNYALRFVRSNSDQRLVNIGEVLISDIVRDVSQQEPRDLRIRRRAFPIDDAPVFELLAARAQALLTKYRTYHETASRLLPDPGTTSVIFGDSASESSLSQWRAHALVSSPPYASALPYIDTDRLSLAAVFGYGSYDRKPLENQMIGSREITNNQKKCLEEQLEHSQFDNLPSSTLDWLKGFLRAVNKDDSAGFRKKQSPSVLLRYFSSMSAVLCNSKSILAPNSHVWLVLGDSRCTVGGVQWNIPTVNEVLEIAKFHSFEHIENIPITVTKENLVNSRNSITSNEIIHLKSPKPSHSS